MAAHGRCRQACDKAGDRIGRHDHGAVTVGCDLRAALARCAAVWMRRERVEQDLVVMAKLGL
jgi:hypothetical protein